MECSFASGFTDSPIIARRSKKKISLWAGRYDAIGPLSPLVGSILALHRQQSLSMISSKVLRAWTEVWTTTSRLRSSIMVPGGRDLGDF